MGEPGILSMLLGVGVAVQLGVRLKVGGQGRARSWQVGEEGRESIGKRGLQRLEEQQPEPQRAGRWWNRRPSGQMG